MKTRNTVIFSIAVFLVITSCSNVKSPKSGLKYNKIVHVEMDTDNQMGKAKQVLRFFRGDELIVTEEFLNNELIKIEGSIPDGPVLSFYDSGKLANIQTYKDQKWNGPSIGYYENGAIKGTVIYSNGTIEGKALMFYSSGKIMSESI